MITATHPPLPAINDRLVSAQDIIDLEPCYSERKVRRIMGGKKRRLSALLRMHVPEDDRLWAVARLLDSGKDRQLVACAMVRHTPARGDQTVWDLLTDERSRVAVGVAEQHAMGCASDEELNAAADAGWDAVRDATRNVAGAATAARAASAASAAGDAVGDAASAATTAAAAWSAAGDPAWAATLWSAARDPAAWTAARKAQVGILLRMLEGGDL